MARRLRPLSGDAIGELPDPCRACLFWELGRPRPDPRVAGEHADELAGDAVVQKQAWCTDRALQEAPPGRLVVVDDEVVGYVLFAPPGVLAPRRAPVPAASADALVLATLWVEPAWRERGLGRLLLQATLREALRLDLVAVEAYGDRRYRARRCVLPATWLLHEGFAVHGEHPRYPLLRLDVRQTSRWARSLEHALDELLERLPGRGRVGVPAPTEPRPEGVPSPT